MTVRILHGDCRDVLATLPENSVDAVVTDPPYDLTSGKRGGTGVASVNLATPYGRARIGTGNGPGGFMGMRWDGTGVAFDSETWRQVLRVLKPGGHLLAFGGTRTYHRMACAVEDAGFDIRDQIGWCFGSGFPKSHNGPWGGTALKPAWEPIVMARKPLIGTIAANVQAHGTGALNIDACRVPSGPDHAEKCASVVGLASNRNGVAYSDWKGARTDSHSELGRWPANLIHDGSDEVLAAFPQQGDGRVFGAREAWANAARFFWSPKASRADRNEGLQGLPRSTTDDGRNTPIDNPYLRGKTERGNHHPTVKPTDLMRYLCRLVTPPGGTVLDPFMGSGSTLKAAELEGFSAIGIELDEQYIEIARRRIAADAPLFANVETEAA